MQYSQAARTAFQHAREEAHALGHDEVLMEHLLLGLLREAYPFQTQITEHGFTPEVLRKRLKRLFPPTTRRDQKSISMSSGVGEVMETAAIVAKQFGQSEILPEHLLISALEALHNRPIFDGLNDEALRAAIRYHYSAEKVPPTLANQPLGKVVLSGLEFHGRHGVFQEETRLGARFVVDAELFFDFAGIPDDVESTIDYSKVYLTVQDEVTAKRYYLIEVLANTIADRLMMEHPRLQRLLIRVHKPHAPLPGVFRDVYAEVERVR
ncbi:dihydroneopterin aldolase [Deinococcus cellulosilyticus]|uniref:7,8-dihydroneopterin aldolase n=1 Tax=Deinococcus cellulosilyticus (strain DSM 18568 / NBRC 106333 / KACC 11606 / 5516J-15) TaxID=1223518 RepID=A0A511N9L1_DEIC1|nr:dihydroneopterin aldolase [Deinococcus cellulosilyticus]GEM49206.1 hypothetical protein DC3_48410 [Deinococcus cellulosilyticus NBRC 106333 = KACC 11606]